MTTKIKTKTLPDKPSALIRMALDDLRKVERSKNYIVYMHDWHRPTDDEKVCEVCFSGAVMAKTLNVKHNLRTDPAELGNNVGKKLVALDKFRKGCIWRGLCYMSIDNKSLLEYRTIPLYSRNKPGFHKAMRKLARDLEFAGL